MKRNFIMALSLMLTSTLSAQEDATTFMGVPVAGQQETMRQQLLHNGCYTDKNSVLKGVVDGSLCTIIINAVNDKVQSITAVEDKSTTDEQLAVDRFNKLVEYYKNNPEYTEFESNDFISPERQTEAKKYITEGWFYAEFFQTTAKQKYTKRMSFRISNEYGDYRIVRHYDKSNEIAL